MPQLEQLIETGLTLPDELQTLVDQAYDALRQLADYYFPDDSESRAASSCWTSAQHSDHWRAYQAACAPLRTGITQMYMLAQPVVRLTQQDSLPGHAVEPESSS